MFKLDKTLSFKLVKLGWLISPIYLGSKFRITNPDDDEETYVFTTNNQIVWFLRGFESGLTKTEEVIREDITDEPEPE